MKGFFLKRRLGNCLLLTLVGFSAYAWAEPETGNKQAPPPEELILPQKELDSLVLMVIAREGISPEEYSGINTRIEVVSHQTAVVSKLADLRRTEIKIRVAFLLPENSREVYSFSAMGKGLEEGERSALLSALNHLHIDSREIELALQKLRALNKTRFY